MNKRLVYFLILAGAILMLNALVLQWFGPPPQPPAPQQAKNENDQIEAAPEDDPTVAPVADPVERPEVVTNPMQQSTQPQQWVALGSADAAKTYSFLVIATNQGASIQTVELNERNFRDLEDRFYKRGHFGNLALTDGKSAAGEPDGAMVGVVGHGTPAAAATAMHENTSLVGLLPLDKLVGVSMGEKSAKITGAADWEAFTKELRVGAEIKVTVNRAGIAGPLVFAGKLGESPLEVVQPEKDDPLSMLFTLEELGEKRIAKDAIGTQFADAEGGVQLKNVVEGGAANAAQPQSLQSGDVITQVNGVAITKVKDLSDLLRDKLPGGSRLRVTYQRQGTEQKTILTLPAELAGWDLRTANWMLGRHNEVDEKARQEKREVGILRDAQGIAYQVTFSRYVEAEKLEFVKTYTLVANEKDLRNYHVKLDLQIVNHDMVARKLAYQLDGPNGLPQEGWWYTSKISRDWGGVGIRDVGYHTAEKLRLIGATHIAADEGETASEMATTKDGAPTPLRYVAVDARYFAAALIPLKPTGQENAAWFANIQPIREGLIKEDPKESKMTNTSFRLTSRVLDLPKSEPADDARGKIEHNFLLFFGPKQPDVLARTGYQLEDLNYYGWFGWVATIMLWFLHVFYSVVGNYGIAIIMLTVLVRACMIPVSIKQTKTAQRMQQLQPEIKKINEKYKGDYQARTKATQELFRSHNYNPMSGCLPVFIQLPIFIGLYRALMVDVELRQQPLIPGLSWCSNLSAPDMLWDWSSFVPDFLSSETGWLGPFFNLLPIFTIGLFIWQQKMFMPPATDEQQAMQQKMMKYMMIVFGIMFFCVPSGLCIYFIASSLWSIGERKLMNKLMPSMAPGAAAAATAPPRPGRPGTNGESAAGKKGKHKHKGRK